MNIAWVVAALIGLAGFLAGLVGAAVRGQTAEGGWRPGAWRWLVLALAGFALLAAGLRFAGADDFPRTYPLPRPAFDAADEPPDPG